MAASAALKPAVRAHPYPPPFAIPRLHRRSAPPSDAGPMVDGTGRPRRLETTGLRSPELRSGLF